MIQGDAARCSSAAMSIGIYCDCWVLLAIKRHTNAYESSKGMPLHVAFFSEMLVHIGKYCLNTFILNNFAGIMERIMLSGIIAGYDQICMNESKSVMLEVIRKQCCTCFVH